MRSATAQLAIVAIFLLVVAGLFNLEVLQARQFRQQSDRNSIRVISQMGTRGRLLDRFGKVIVDSSLSYDAMILPQAKDGINEVLRQVAKVLQEPFEGIRNKFRKNFVSPSMPVLIARNIGLHKAIALEEVKSDVGGILIQPQPIRRYPFSALACHALGYLNEIDHWRLTRLADYGYKTRDIVGYTGLEEKYDYYLRQEEGGMSVEIDHQGRPVRVLGFRPPKNGLDIQLTLDLEVQKIAEEKMRDRVGSVIIMEPATGEIIAMASSPTFDPALFIKKPGSSSISELFTDSQAPLLNRAINGAYPAASVFKVVVATAALETKKITPFTTFTCTGGMQLGNRKFACWDTHGMQNLIEGLTHSCDVYFYHTGLLVGAQGIHDYALRFGLGKPTQIDIPYETAGLVPDPLWKKITRFKSWYKGDTVNFSIGQGDLLVTPLQVTRMMAVFANKGYLVTPYIVKSIGGKDVTASKRKLVKLPFKKETLDAVRQGLKDVVAFPSGTANMLSGLSVSVAGKTGTAEVSRGQPHAWFAGFFPFADPAYVICVFLEHGGGGQAAVAVTKQIIYEMGQQGLIKAKDSLQAGQAG